MHRYSQHCSDGLNVAVTRAERAFALLALVYLVGTFNPIFGGLRPADDPTIEDAVQGNALAQVAGAAIYGLAFYFLLRSGWTWRHLLENKALAVFILFVFASVAWSQSPDVSVRRIAGVMGCVIVASYLATRFSPEDVVRLLARAYGVAVVASILLSAILPSVGGSLFDAPGGVWGHKNDLGRALVFSTACAAVLLISPGSVNRIVLFALFTASLLLIAVSRSAQSMLVTAITLGGFLPLVVILSKRHTRLSPSVVLALLVFAATAAMAAEYLGPIVLDLLSRDTTLTDRTLIWEIVIALGEERPWLGYGYGAFWTSQAAYIFGDRWQVIDHAHNGYLDIWLELGYVGLALFAWLLISASGRAWNVALGRGASAARFFPVFLLAAMMLNTVGHVFPAHNSVYWMLLCYSALLPTSAVSNPRRSPVALLRGAATQ